MLVHPASMAQNGHVPVFGLIFAYPSAFMRGMPIYLFLCDVCNEYETLSRASYRADSIQEKDRLQVRMAELRKLIRVLGP